MNREKEIENAELTDDLIQQISKSFLQQNISIPSIPTSSRAKKMILDKGILTKIIADIKPPYTRGKSPARRVWQEGPPFPDLSHTPSETIPFKFPDNNDAISNALLPYIGAGFTPIPTSGAHLQCGLHALAGSLKAARSLATAPHGPSYQDYKAEDFERWVNDEDPDWVEVMNEWRKEYWYVPKETRDQMELGMRNPRLLETEGLKLLLRTVNRKLKTNYSLGIIVDGYRVKWDHKSKAYDYNYICRISAQDQGSETSKNLTGDTSAVIWVWNDNLKSQLKDHRVEEHAESHWCAFAPGEGVRYREKSQLQKYQEMVDNWGLNDAAQAQVEEGVWVVHTDIPAHNRNGRNKNTLHLSKGQFVRLAKPPDSLVVSEGQLYVCTTDDNRTGLVPTASLTKIEIGARLSEGSPQTAIVTGTSTEHYEFDIAKVVSPVDELGILIEHPVLGEFEFEFGEGDILLKTDTHGQYFDVIGTEGNKGMAHKEFCQPVNDP